VAKFHRFGPMDAGPLQVYFRVAPGTDRYLQRADVWFVRDGRVMACLEGLEAAASSSLNRLAEPSAR
jgi:hypothetical protein